MPRRGFNWIFIYSPALIHFLITNYNKFLCALAKSAILTSIMDIQIDNFSLLLQIITLVQVDLHTQHKVQKYNEPSKMMLESRESNYICRKQNKLNEHGFERLQTLNRCSLAFRKTIWEVELAL